MKPKPVRWLTQTALLFAASVVLSVVEGLLPSLPIPVPGVKFGLSNIPVMYALLTAGFGSALAVAALKSGFILLSRGGISGLVSLCGGLLSVTVMWLMKRRLQEKITFAAISLSGAVAHNLGQWAVVSVLYTGSGVLYYLPALVVFGMAAGCVTAVLLRVVIPLIRKLE